jgi:hypothetical protein
VLLLGAKLGCMLRVGNRVGNLNFGKEKGLRISF